MEPIPRLTAPTLDVLGVLLGRTEPTWGLLVIKESGRPPGTIYPLLERLEERGWVTSEWDDDAERPGPRRRLYTLTHDGAVAARAAVASRPRPRPRTHPAPAPGTARVAGSRIAGATA